MEKCWVLFPMMGGKNKIRPIGRIRSNLEIIPSHVSVKNPTVSVRRLAWSLKAENAMEFSWTSALFSRVNSLTSIMAPATWSVVVRWISMEKATSATRWLTSSIPLRISAQDSELLLDKALPSPASWIMPSIRRLMSLAFSALDWDRIRISWATTANPWPFRPALAASMAALIARIEDFLLILLRQNQLGFLPTCRSDVRDGGNFVLNGRDFPEQISCIPMA